MSGGGQSPVQVTEPVPSVTATVTEDAVADNMKFADAVATSMIARPSKSLPFDDLSGGMDLADYFSRWTLINTCTWAGTNAFGYQLMQCDPWYGYLTNTAISRKLAGFRRLRADIDVRYIINASATQYGCAVVGCVPQGTEGYGVATPVPQNSGTGVTTVINYYDTLPTVAQIYSMDFVNELRPADSDSIEFQLPWISTQDAIDLLNVTQVSSTAGGPQTQWRVVALVVAPLANSTDAATVSQVTIRCFARLRNVAIDVPVPQSTSTRGKQGPVGQVSTAISKASRAFKDVPFLSSVAGGVEVISGAVGTIADYFGFTRESVNPEYTVNAQRAYTNVTNADAGDYGVSLSLLKDNKVSIDSAIVGSSQFDDMAFKSILSRRFFINGISWTTSQSAGTPLATVYVAPWYTSGPTLPGSTVYPSPSAVVANCFRYWRGSMEYELEIVASKQHRGRIQIVYYPSQVSISEDPTNSSYNIIYDLDISKTRKFRIGWAQLAPALTINVLNQNTWNSANFNGYIQMVVQTELTAPDPTASVQILMFGRCGQDMQFYYPMAPPSVNGTPGFLLQSGDDIDDLVPLYSGDAMGVVGGEQVQSIRTMIQTPFISYLPTLTPSSAVNLTGTNTFDFKLGFDYMPFYNGCLRPETGFTDPQYLPSYLRHFCRMYLGWRGSRNLKFTPYGALTAGVSTVSDIAGTNTNYMVSIGNSYPASEGANILSMASSVFLDNTCLVANDARNGTMVEARLPYWSRFRYNLSRVGVQSLTGATGFTFPTTVDFRVVTGTAVISSAQTAYFGAVWESAADDFSLVQFRFVPTCYLNGTIT